MPQILLSVLDDLGLIQYLGAFRDQGFDTWDTVLDITEADLEALGVKLGHRRKLQRRIAHSRGVPTNAALPTSSQNDSQELSSLESEQLSTSREDGSGEATVTKRRYRRHPKPDKNAPERPPSAYVLFSNKTREELKGQSLSFTEIAKIVGENWQRVSKERREKFEAQAKVAKDKYRRELAEYKKTPEYEQYAQYLQDFKKKQQARGRSVPNPSRSSTSGMGRSHRSSASSGVDASNGTGKNGPYQKIELARQQKKGPIGAPSEPQEQQIQPSETSASPGAISQGSPFTTRNVSSAVQSGPYRHQKLPSLSDVLDNRIESGQPTTSPQGSVWGSCSLSGRSAISHEQSGSGASPVSTGSGYAISGSETDVLPIQSLISSNEAQSVYRPAPSMHCQPLLAYGGFR